MPVGIVYNIYIHSNTWNLWNVSPLLCVQFTGRTALRFSRKEMPCRLDVLIIYDMTQSLIVCKTV